MYAIRSYYVASIIAEMPLRNLVTMSQGRLKPGLMRAMIHIRNNFV